MASREDVIEALRKVALEGRPLPETGRMSEILIDGQGRVTFSLEIEPSEARRLEPIRAAAQRAVEGLPGVKQALVSLTGSREPGGSRAGQPSRPAGPPRPQSVEGVKHVFAVASGKGGVGKSTVACNLALALRAQGLKVGLLDADIYGPSAPKLFGLGGRKPRIVSGRILEPVEGYGVQVMSIGFMVEDDSAMIWRGPMVMAAITQMLREVAWSELDALVVDMPPGTGDAQLTMAQNVPLAGAVIVSTPQDLSLIDARRGVAMFRKVAVPILGIVENMSTFVCPRCGAESHIFGHGGARAEAERIGVPFLGEVPLHMTIRESSDAGRPPVATAPDGPQAQAFREIAGRIWQTITSGGANRPPPRIVIE